FLPAFWELFPGGDLLSHRVSPAVPSALENLTSEFGMGSGVAPPVWPPEIFWCLERLSAFDRARLIHRTSISTFCKRGRRLRSLSRLKRNYGDQATRTISTG